MRYDVAIIGGGVAGLQAALTLARCLYNIVLIDAGKPRHHVAPQMHNLIGADGVEPEEFYRRAHAQLAQYPNLTRVNATVVDGGVDSDFSFHLVDDRGERYHAGAVVFACGVKDVLPEIDGLAELWGKEVQHCAFCHGYEVRGRVITVRTDTARAWAMVEQLAHLTRKLHFLLEDGPPDDVLDYQLERCGITYETARLTRVEKDGAGLLLTLDHGKTRRCDALFLQPGHAPRFDLPARFGCSITPDGHIQANGWGHTGIRGLYTAGDAMAGSYSQLAACIKSGLDTAAMVHADLSRAALDERS